MTTAVHLERCPHCGIHAVTKWPHNESRVWLISCKQCQRFGSGTTQAQARERFVGSRGA